MDPEKNKPNPSIQDDKSKSNPTSTPEARVHHPPDRYGEWHYGTLPPLSGPFETSTPQASGGIRDADNTSIRSRRSRTSRTSNATVMSQSEIKRRLIEAELKAAEEEAKINNELLQQQMAAKHQETKLIEQQAEVKKALVKKRLELEKAKIDEEAEGGEDWENDSQKLSDDDEKKSTPPKTTAVTTGKVMNLHTPANSYTSSIHDLTDIEETSTTVKKISEAVCMMANLMDQQSRSRPPIQADTSIARKTYGKDLTPFSGNPEEWPSFLSEYNECSDVCGFSARENLLRLKKCLKGKARETVQALFSSPENVDKIIETLKMRFGRPEFIVKVLIEKVKNVGGVKEEKPESIIDFATTVQNLATTAEALKCHNHMTNPQLLEDLYNKLPAAWRTKWCEFVAESGTASPTVRHFADWIHQKARALSLMSFPTSCTEESKKFSKDAKPDFKKKTSIFTTTGGEITPPTTYKDRKSNYEKSCIFCTNSKHDIGICYSFKKLALDDKWKWVLEHDICYCCLKIGHTSKVCRGKKECGVNKCTAYHHRILHREAQKKEPTIEAPKKSENKSNEKSEVLVQTQYQASYGNKILYKIAPVVLSGPAGSMHTFALLDEASAYTLLDSKVAEELGIVGEPQPLTVRGIGDLCSRDQDSQNVELKISGEKFKENFIIKNVRTRAHLGLPSQSIDVSDLPSNWREMKRLNIKSMKNATPTILIGLDNADLIYTQKKIHGPNKRLILGKTKLGWIIYGNIRGGDDDGFTMHLSNDDDCLHQMVKEYFNLESDGIKILKEKLVSKEESRAVAIMEKTTSRVGGSWETGLLWRYDDVQLPPSRNAATKRLVNMERKIDRDPELAKLYCEKIQYYLDNGYARQISKDEADEIGPRTWYLPHFGVVNPNKPGKIRFVFDAAAKVNGVSLNTMLLTGPDLLVSLPGTLIRFRQKQVAFSGDIKDFFHRVKVRKEDQPSHRFLWRGMDRDRDPDTYTMLVSIFGAACTPFTSQAAKNKNAEEFASEFPEAATAIIRKHYMDDYLDCVDTVAQAIKLIKEVTEIHRRGGFEIGKFTSSHLEVLQSIPPELRANEEIDLGLGTELNIERVLGLQWNPNNDSLSFNLKFHKVDKEILSGEKIPTKRQVLKVLMSMFDPLGIIGHYTVQAKILLQDIWRSGLGWDDEMSDQLYVRWKRWIQQLDELKNFRLSRCYGMTTDNDDVVDSRQLHIFCDASELAYCAVAYLRIESGGSVQVSFIMSKTRVTPLKPVTIPRLELQASVLGSRLHNFIKTHLELEVQRTFFWSDNKTVLLWLRSEARDFKTFVANRVGEILEATNVADWRWMPTKENAADDGTRDVEPADLSPTSRWICGPDFLKLSIDHWPKEVDLKTLKQEVDENDLEIKEERVLILQKHDKLVDETRFQFWLRLVRTVARALRFIKNCHDSRKCDDQNSRTKLELTVTELAGAEVCIWKQHQLEVFGGELDLIRKGKPLPKNSILFGLSAFLDSDGLLKLNSRIKNAPVPESTKAPVIIHGKHYITRLLVMHHHVKVGHHGQERVLNDLRQQYWIIGMRAAVKNAWNNCRLCKHRRAKPQVPEMGQLPWVRLNHGRLFQFTGMDYFGPMEVAEGRKHVKVYGVLFTCLTTRAVHLEIAESLTTDSCIMAIRRMVSRRGKPVRIYSDNGTNLPGADNELTSSLQQLDQEVMEAELSTKGLDWHFIPPAAPHMGGSWERMVQSVKKAIRGTIDNNRTPRRELLQTLFAEAENTVNSRPLTHVSLDPDDPESLTPNHFLIGSSGALAPPGNFGGPVDLKKQWRAVEQMSAEFWRRWIREYLPTLTRRTKWHSMVKPVEVGDVVIVVDDQLERNTWPLGIIMKVFPGRDGKVRVVEVKAKDKLYHRPVSKICVLDVAKEDVEPPGFNIGGENVGDVEGDKRSL